jgi:hypothetical protein
VLRPSRKGDLEGGEKERKTFEEDARRNKDDQVRGRQWIPRCSEW